ncbi:hypothetical protein ACTID9_16830 [Brevibacillus fluminis]|uniref:hypothetical protein n=1 Tax=Brevibacillus fluminis TaxID=511487 RepID=UPI003F8A8A6C
MEDLLLYVSFDELISWFVFLCGAVAPFIVIGRVQLPASRTTIVLKQAYEKNINPVLVERYPSLAPLYHVLTIRSDLDGDPYPVTLFFRP